MHQIALQSNIPLNASNTHSSYAIRLILSRPLPSISKTSSRQATGITGTFLNGNDTWSSLKPEQPEIDKEYAPAPMTVALILFGSSTTVAANSEVSRFILSAKTWPISLKLILAFINRAIPRQAPITVLTAEVVNGIPHPADDLSKSSV